MGTVKFSTKQILNAVIKKCKISNYLKLSIYIFITTLILYSQYIFGDKVLAFTDFAGADSVQTYEPIYELFSSLIKTGSLSEFTFRYGFGTSIFSLTNWVANPFQMINVLYGIIFGEAHISESIVIVKILVHLCDGLLMYRYLKRYSYRSCALMIASYIYAFNGYIFGMGEHFVFSSYTAYIVLLLILLDNIIYDKRNLKNFIKLILFSALTALSGIWSSYIIFLTGGIYVIVKVFYFNAKFRQKLMYILSCCIPIILGLMLGAPLFLTSAEYIINSSRLTGDSSLVQRIFDSFSFSSFETIHTNVLRLFSNGLEGSVTTWRGSNIFFSECVSWTFSAMLIPMLCQYVYMTFAEKIGIKKIIGRLLPIAAVIFILTSNFIPSLYNVFMYPSYRFVFAFIPFFAVIVADVCNKIFNGVFNRKINYIALAVSFVIVIYGGLRAYDTESNSIVTAFMAITLFSLMIGCFLMDIISVIACSNHDAVRKKTIRAVSIMFSFSIALNMLSENFIIINYNRSFVTKESRVTDLLIDDVISDINSYENNEKNFYRFTSDYRDGRMAYWNYSFQLPLRTGDFYDSVLNSNIFEFIDKMLEPNQGAISTNYIVLGRTRNNAIAEDLTGIKYSLALYHYNDSCLKDYGDTRLYQNKIDSAGFLFNEYISQNEADQMTSFDRQINMGNRLIIDNPPDDISNYSLSPSVDNSVIDPSVIIPDGMWVNTNNISPKIEQNNDGTYNIEFNSDDIGTSAIVIPINTQIYDSNTAQHTINAKSKMPMAGVVAADSEDGIWHSIYSDITQTEDQFYSLTCTLPQNTTHFAIVMNETGETEVSLSCWTSDITYRNEGISLQNPDMGGRVFGSVDAPQNSIFYVPIPYETNWDAYIDGKPVQILKANYGFCAIMMPEGIHDVEFVYQSRAFHLGILISFITTAFIIAGIIIYVLLKKRRRGEPDEKNS